MGNLLIAFTDRNVASTDRNVAFTNICRDGLAGAGPIEEIAALQNMLDRAGNDELVNSTDEGGFTALELACMYERVHIVRFLLENDAEVNQRNSRGFTPLIFAVVSPTNNDNEGVNIQHQIIALLLKHHADPNMGVTVRSERFSCKMTPSLLIIAIQNGDLHIVQMLLRAGASDTQYRYIHCLQAACEQNRPDIVEELLNFPNLAVGDENLPQNSFRNRAFLAAVYFLHENNVSAAFGIFEKMRSNGLSLDGDFITSILQCTTLLEACLKLTSNDFRAEAVHQALELGVDPTYPIPVDRVVTDRMSPLTYVLSDPGMNSGTIYLLLRAYTGLGQLQFVSQRCALNKMEMAMFAFRVSC